MKTRFFPGLAVVLFACFVSCNDSNDSDDSKDIIMDLVVEKESIIIANGQPAYLKIVSGNNDYTVTSLDDAIVECSPEGSSDNSYGAIILKGKSNGETIIKITDNITGQNVDVNLKVIDAYMIFKCGGHSPVLKFETWDYTIVKAVSSDMESKASISAGGVLVLIKNIEHSFHAFASQSDYEDGKVEFSGSYEFTLIDKTPYLVYRYTKNDVAQTIISKISSESGSSLVMINDFLDLGWNISTLKSIRANVIGKIFFITVEDFTDEYKPTYSIIQSALLQSVFTINIPSVSDLPGNIFSE